MCGRAIGVPVKCHAEGCCNYYHVSCAQDTECVLDAEETGGGVVFTITCPSHTLMPSQLSPVKERQLELSPHHPQPSNRNMNMIQPTATTATTATTTAGLANQEKEKRKNMTEITEEELSAIAKDLEDVDWDALVGDVMQKSPTRRVGMDEQPTGHSTSSSRDNRKRDQVTMTVGENTPQHEYMMTTKRINYGY